MTNRKLIARLGDHRGFVEELKRLTKARVRLAQVRRGKGNHYRDAGVLRTLAR